MLRSRAELYAHVRQATEPILALAIPVALFVSLGADLWLRVLFGHAYASATLALRVLAASSVLIYVAILYALTLIMLERAWTVTWISVAALLVNVALNVWLIPRSMVLFGEGGGGVGCALAALGTHVFVAVTMIVAVGREAFDPPTVSLIGKSLGACVLVVIVDRATARLGGGRLVVDGIVYLDGGRGQAGALRMGEKWRMLAAALRTRGRARA